MGFLDTLKDKVRSVTGGEDYYDDEYYDEGYEGEDDYASEPPARNTRRVGEHTHLLGNTPRPEAESVSVYTRSGRPVSAQQRFADAQPTQSFQPQRQPGYEPPLGVQTPAPNPNSVLGATRSVPMQQVPRVNSGQLPPYVLRPVAYDDVETVVRRVKTNQPVVLVFRNTNTEIAKRIIDFCFGLSYGLNGAMEELGDRVFAVLPAGAELSSADINKLVADGDLVR